MSRPTHRRAALTAAAILAVLSALPAAAQAAESPTPATGASDATVLAARAYPGVQLIATTYRGTVSVREPVVNEKALAALNLRLANQAALGTIDLTEEALIEEIIEAIETSPDTYLKGSSKIYSESASLTGVGTGWAVTPDGYLITAAHVVETPKAELRQEFAVNSLRKLGDEFMDEVGKEGIPLTRDQAMRFRDTVLEWLAKNLTVSDLSVSVEAQIALGQDGLGKTQKPFKAEIVDVGEPYPGSDIALLKIDGQEHLPTIDLGPASDVSPGSRVYVVGFPAASTFSPGLSDDAKVQPTVTEGPVTAVKSTESGMPVIQTQAPASPGNSGGPVLSDKGSSVGVLVASAVGGDGVAAQGQNFVIPTSEVLDMLKRHGVTPAKSDTTVAYDQAVSAFYRDHFKEALPLFEKAESLYPAHPFAKKFITDSKTAIDQGRDRTPQSSLLPTGLLVGGLVTATVVGAGAVLLLRSRRSRAIVPAVPGAAGHVEPPLVPPGGAAPQAVPGLSLPVQASGSGPEAPSQSADKQPGAAGPVEPPLVPPGGAGPEAPSQSADPQPGAAGPVEPPLTPPGTAEPPLTPPGPAPQPQWDPQRGWYLPDGS